MLLKSENTLPFTNEHSSLCTGESGSLEQQPPCSVKNEKKQTRYKCVKVFKSL